MAERVEGGWTYKHDKQHAHTSATSACHPLGRSATLLVMHGAREDFAISLAGLANHQFCVPEAESLCVCCSCAALCAVWWLGSVDVGRSRQHPCVVAGRSCNGVLHPLTAEEARVVRGRCLTDNTALTDASVICKRHFNELLQRYKPTRCAACPQPLSSSGSMACPEWMREQLGAHHGAFVHVQPCYKAAVAAKKQQAAVSQPMEVERENILPFQSRPLTSVSHASTQIHLRMYPHAHM